MGVLGKLFFLIIVGVAIFLGIKLNSLFQVPPLPHLENTWWAVGQPSKVDTSIKPFKINVPEKVLIDLKDRLKNARPFAPPLEGVHQDYGMNTDLLREIVEFWKTRYDWREREKFLNQFPQFITNIQGLDIHFIHVKPVRANGLKVLPLLLVHGWPGSVREFYEIIPKLTTPRKGDKFVFEVIVPSLPGYGFSQAASKPGLSAYHVSVIFKNLMERLGFNKYYIQGGDWGAVVVAGMSTLYPENILGVHSNMCIVDSPPAVLKYLLASLYPSAIIDEKYQDKMYPVSKLLQYILLEFGYMHLQATKPDTVGVGLNDSPVGLAAYILEKFTTWTDPAWKSKPDGGLKEKFSYVDLLDNVMIYWVTNSITTSMRIYAETFNKATNALQIPSIPVTVPSACLRLAHELFYMPDSLLSVKYKNLIQTTDVDVGGHFAAFEVPEILAKDIWMSVSKMEQFHTRPKMSS
ncbi:Jheh2 [Trypoxylus dichotomus]